MSVFSPENIAKAIERVPGTSSKDLRALLSRAQQNGLDELIAEIEKELRLRGPIALDARSAQKHARWSEETADLDLVEAIELAFTKAPVVDYEIDILREIAKNPGVGYQSLSDIRGKGDVGLILGHMVYDRLGFFRKFLHGTDQISDLLFERESVSGRKTYRLTSEAERAFKALSLI